jgi:putative DNA primase/helicase
MGSSEQAAVDTAAVEAEVRRKLRQEVYERKADFTDRGRANRLRQIVGGTLRYVPERRQWLMWLDRRWYVDEHETFARTRALQVAYSYEEVALVERNKGNVEAAERFTKEALRCRNRATLDNMIHELSHTLGVPLAASQLDRDPWLLGVQNGTVDLRTGELRTEEAAEDYITKRCTVNYNPDAKAPRWERFIVEVTGSPAPGAVGAFEPRPELARYLQKMLGYCCTGLTREHKIFIAIGEGSNGKTVIFEKAVKQILGDYAVKISADALMATRAGLDAERPTAMLATLAGARFVLASESKDGNKLDVGLVKGHTGDVQMTARRMRENPITFDITHKLLLSTNIKPALDHLDTAIRGRLHMIPFDRRWNRPGDVERDPALPDGDKNLDETLKAEAEGILRWLVAGAVMYASEGLDPPEAVTGLTRDYVRSQDHVGRWIDEQCERCSVTEGTPTLELYTKFISWCTDEGVEAQQGSVVKFGKALDAKQVEAGRTKHGARRGLRPKAGTCTADDFEDRTADETLKPAPAVSYETHVQPLIGAAVLVAKSKVMQLFKDYNLRNAKDLKPENYGEVIAKLQAIKEGVGMPCEFEDRTADGDLA